MRDDVSVGVDRMDPARAAALHATLGRDGPAPASGEPLPAFWHQVYFWDARAPSHLGRDGHPRTGGLIPDLGLPRRMWAGGRLTWHGPLLAGIRAEKRTHLVKIRETTGRSGPLAFVTLRHEIRQRNALILSEEQDLVYRPDDRTAGAPQVTERALEPDQVERVGFDATALFRYSALTFNGHRIHYDADYCRAVEGYPGLVVHGPLLATLMMGLAERREGTLARFSFRATSPLCLPEVAEVCARGQDYWVRGADGRICMTGRSGVTA